MKKISVLSLVLALAISVTGCFGGESKLYSSLNKMQNITSMESDMEIGFNLEGEGFAEDEQLILQQVASSVNSTKLKMHIKQLQNKEKTASKAEVVTNMNLGGIGMDMKVWVDADMSTAEPKVKEIIEMPQTIMNSMFPEDAEKKYIVYDFEKLMKESNEELDFSELMKFSKDFQPKVTEFMKEIQKDFKPGLEIVKEKDAKLVGNEKLDIYELKLDDATLKELVKYSVNYALDKEATMNFIKEYMKAVMNIAKVSETEKTEVKDQLADFENKLPEFKTKFNEFMDKYKDVKILGDKGIVIEYGINKDGYIVHETGNIDLRIDLENITKVAQANNKDKEKPVTEMKGIIKLGINYNVKNSNINSKDIKVEMPKVDEKNSVDYMEMMKKQMEKIN
ncbi:hypothetical protein AAK964_00460 [Tissierella praeacuta]|uniref:hypothetical protein n=1 Tax=Tissierella praeacuta TaxID=43131 RepID=UPI000EC44063|nr:hypothetical protein [Tissierella praeacuta]HAE92179.1 hypothetical protein [Tissierella sp.]